MTQVKATIFYNDISSTFPFVSGTVKSIKYHIKRFWSFLPCKDVDKFTALQAN